MSSCNLFNDSLINIIGGVSGFSIDKSWLQSLIPKFDAQTSGIWYPIIINHSSSKSEYGGLLSNPQKINDSITDPCNCGSTGRTLARNVSLVYNDFSEDPENGVFCDYCQKLYATNAGVMNCIVNVDYKPKNSNGKPSTIQWPLASLTPVPIGSGQNYSVTCCSGGCDTRMLTDDIVPKIPYLSNNYTTKFFDFKHLKQFPSIENPGLGIEKFGSYTGPTDRIQLSNATVHFDWILKPRLGEIPPSVNETYHSNLYVHEKSYSRYLLNNKTCGNFILQKVNAPTPISAWQSGNMPLLSNLTLLSGIMNYGSGISGIIPSIDQFDMPYGISDNTHYNIFLKSPADKQGGFWKWNFTSGVLCWYRYYDKDRENDNRVIPGVDLYISPGDVFFAKNDGPEPLADTTGNPELCKHKICPSGLKLTKYQTTSTNETITIVPSGSEFIYISNNIYPYVYSFANFFLQNIASGVGLNATNITYNDILNYASIIATGPMYSEVTVSLYKLSNINNQTEKKNYIDILNSKGNNYTITDVDTWLADPNNADKLRDAYYRLIRLNQRLTDKKMPSYNNLNMIANTDDLVNTLVDKYGLYVWVPPDTNASITLNNAVYPHAYFDVDFEPVIKLKDTRNSSSSTRQPKDCSLQLKGRTKIFGYDQEFSIGESKLKANILEDNLVYAAEYVGNPLKRTITDVSSTMSTYFNDEKIYSTAFGSYQTSIVDTYSRFPSVSSTLDTTFTNLSEEQDSFGDIGVFFLQKDAQYKFLRKYDAFCAQPNINIVGFHEDGGFYYESKLLSKNTNDIGTVGFKKNWRPPRARRNPIIRFNTYDLGIKLYSININRLRNSSNTNCKTFPLTESCSCWGINKVTNFPFKCGDTVVYETPNLFVPFLSTQSVPMMSYGGFDETTINSYLGDFRIPNHPSIGSTLPTIDKVIDPENINGCTSTASVTLPNYVSTNWKIQIPNFDFDDASLWVRYTDSFRFANDRTQNRVVIDGQEVFPNEQKIIDTNSNTFDISIHNQLLSNIADGILYHKNMYSCSLDNTYDPYDNTPNYAKPSTVSITFGRVPNPTVLALKMPGIQSMGKLKRSLYDPNIGLQLSNSKGSSLNLDKFNGLFNFDYGQRLFNSKDNYTPLAPNDLSLSGSMSIESLTRLLSFIGAKNETKKLRLYLKVNNKWYEYEDHRAFGYYNTQEQQQYHSWPTFFAQCHLQTDQAFGPFIQAIPKVPLEHIYCINSQSWQNIVNAGDAAYPYFDHKFFRSFTNKKKIYIKGSRAYFMFPNIIGVNQSADNDNYIINNQINITNEEKVKYIEDKYKKYIPINVSTGLVPITIYSISQKDINIYRADNEKRKSMPGGFSLSQEVKPNKIIKKTLIANMDFYASGDINTQLINPDNNIYTEFELEQDHPHDEGYIYLSKPDENPITNLTLLPTSRGFNIENAELIRFNNDPNNRNIFSSKWGDLLYYNNTADILNNKQYYDSINSVYGPFLYENTMNYIMANNFMYSHQLSTDSGTVVNKFPMNFYVRNTESSGLVSFDSPRVLYYLHQPFSLGNPTDRYDKSISRYNLFKNQNPVLDINLYETGSPSDRAFVKARVQEYDPAGIGMTGILFISGIYRPTYDYPKLISNHFDFFVNLNNKFYLKPTPITDNGILSKSLVITDTYTNLESIVLKNEINATAASACTNVIIPNIGTTISTAGKAFDWSNFTRTSKEGSIYASYPILCDRDVPGECGSLFRSNCSMSTIGNVLVSAKYNNYQYKYKNISSITDDEVEYSISVDAGLYCGLSSTGDMPYIVRSVIPGYSALFPTRTLDSSSTCVNGVAYPPLDRGLSVWDNIFQSEVENNIIAPKNIDHWANETLFRSIHGSRQNINLSDISSTNSSNSIKNYGDILQTLISNPKDNISVLYDNIPYDYDTSATMPNFKLEGAIRIYGPAAVGDKVTIRFNDNIYNIILKDDGNDIYIECPELNAKGLIMERGIKTTSFYIRQAGTASIMPGAVERVIATCKSPSSYGISTSCRGGIGTNFQAVYPGIVSPTCFKDTLVDVPDNYSVSAPQIINDVPCSAFQYNTARPDYDSPLDNFFTKNTASTAIGAPTLGGSPLECAGYSFNTCRVKQNCCDGETRVISNLSYRIKDCHYDFIMYGLVTKSINNIGQLSNNYATITCATPYSDAIAAYQKELARVTALTTKCCDCANLPFYVKIPAPSDCFIDPFCCKDFCLGELGDRRGTVIPINSVTCKESLIVPTSDPTTPFNPNPTGPIIYELVETISITYPTDPFDPTPTSVDTLVYDPNFVRTICTFIYNNNEVKLYAGVSAIRDGVEVYNGGNCASISTSSCPSISITLPNSNYGIDDTASASCENCSTKSNFVDIIDNPKWELQNDTVYCLLGAEIIGGSLNPSDFTHEFQCLGPDATEEEKSQIAAIRNAGIYARGRKCGTPVNRACTEWHHFASNPMLGLLKSKPSSKCSEQIVVENAYHINIPDWTTSSAAVAAFNDSFRARMEEIYRNQHYCTNTYEYSEDQLIEGPIPGSCSLEFATISWPMIGVQLCAKKDGSGNVTAEVQEKDTSLKIIIAYMKYKYKHPLNIIDKIIDNQNLAGDVSSADCRVYFSAGGTVGCRTKYFGNMRERLQSTEKATNSCKSSPNCYDKSRPCDPNNWCCKIDKTGSQYLLP